MNTETDHIDDDEDLSTADRGDELAEDTEREGADDADREDAPARDAKGRFASKEGDKEGGKEEEEEEEEEEGEEEEEEEEDEGDPAAKKDSKNYAIRLDKTRRQRDEARQQAAALEARLAKLEEAAAPAKEKEDPSAKLQEELDGLYEQVEEARADGETKKAAQLQRRIDTINHKLVAAEAEKLAKREAAVTTIGARFDALLDVAESRVPAIQPGSDEYDEEAVRELAFHIQAYERSGMPADKALVKAIKTLHRVDLLTKETPTAKGKDKEDDKAKPAKKPVDVAKALDTQRRQPPDASARGVSRDDSKIRVEQLTDDDFAKLPESKKAELRGDYIA